MERAESTTEEHATGRGERTLFDQAWSELDDALASGGHDAAAEVARRRWFDLLAGPVPDRAAALRRLPPGTVSERPLLTLLAGHTDPSAHPHRTGGLRRVGDSAALLGDPDRDLRRIDRAILLSDQAQVHLALGRAQSAVAAARGAATELEHLSADDRRNADTVSGLHAHVGTSLLYTGNSGEALAAFERGLAHAHPVASGSSLGNVVMLALLHARNGDSGEAREHIRTARARAPQLRHDDAMLLSVAKAILALDDLDQDAARENLADAAVDLRTTPHWMPYAVTAATLELVCGHPGRGLAHLDQTIGARGPEGRSAAVRAALATARAVLELGLGHPESAEAVLERDAGEIEKRIGSARVQLFLGRHGAALQHLRPLANAVLSTRRRAEAVALEAAALLRFSDEDRVTSVVDHLGAIIERSGLLLPLALLPAADLARVTHALSALGYGETLALDRIIALVRGKGPDIPLTPRETAVLATLLQHPSHSAIAAQLNVSVNTVKSQLRSVYRKLGVSTRDEAIAIALDRHLLVERE
ncbi:MULTISPECIES: helix-turn-helix transcriptional regulator [unclassified Leifsonia]|uniref:helix-turn-helix transcriptional regulator n=1 Tax=unclassified Leifsonia TaxID=2663824 RepID=UPI0003767A9B|nr:MULTISPECIES: helix-turn-helix transcriptional regulator [unclassified Leifsonia]TDP98551.1 LuxR family maltose regulon positive regulatory protein [Leifsonia sp. 115AMFTsu3.1]